MTIYARGETLFLYAEMEDLERCEQMEAVDPVSQEWEASMTTLLDRPYDDEEPGIFAKLEEVWRFGT